MRTRHTRKLISSALGLVVLGCTWFYLAPVPLGGSTTYVVTKGISMEPHFHTGDLALVRSQSSYRVGEVVAYHNKLLHTIVLHRIIGREGARYIFKGDNNNFVDPEHPAADQLIGALWLHIPAVGGRLQALHSPLLMGALLFFGVLLLSGGVFARRRRLRGRQRRAGEDVQARTRRSPRHSAEPVVGVLVIALLALLPFVAVALLAFTRAPTARRSVNIPYEQSGRFSYSADATPGPAYPGDVAVTGDPLFTHVLHTVDLRFDYLFHTAAKHSLTGKTSLSEAISSSSGWKKTLPLGPTTYFRGDRAVASGTLDVSALLALIHSVETTTGVKGNYTLTLIPRVSVSGHAEAVPVRTTFSPEIEFALNELEIQPTTSTGTQPSVSASAAFGGRKPPANPFTPSTSGSVKGTRYQPQFVSLLFAQPSVATARTIVLSAIAIIVGALVAILALLRPLLTLLRPPRRDESASIIARYGGLIIPVARVQPLPGVAVIDVADMDALVRIAEHYDRSILHEASDRGESFWVADESGQFRYALGSSMRAMSGGDERIVAPGPLEQHASDVDVDGPEPTGTIPTFDASTIVARAPFASAYEPADLDRMQARAAFAQMTGLEWAPRS
jgi:signal peptidase I